MKYDLDAINAIRDILINNEETIAVAESVTAGYLQPALSTGTDASKYFQGGITAYNIGQKARHLHIDPIFGGKVNCVAPKIADTMAIEVSKMFSSDYGLSITGYASIVPECEEGVVFAFFSLSYKQQVVLRERLISIEVEAYNVKEDYTNQVMDKMRQYLQTK